MRLNEPHVKSSVVSHKHGVPDKFNKLFQYRLQFRSILNHVIIDIGQLLDMVWNALMRVDKSGVSAYFLALVHLNCGQLDNLVCGDGQTCGFNIEYHVSRTAQFNRLSLFHDIDGIIHNVGLDAVQHFDPVFLCVLGRFRVTLHPP